MSRGAKPSLLTCYPIVKGLVEEAAKCIAIIGDVQFVTPHEPNKSSDTFEGNKYASFPNASKMVPFSE